MRLNRRRFLRAAGVTLALPWLDALAAAQPSPQPSSSRRRMICMGKGLAMHPPSFFPEKAGKDYVLSPYLEFLKDYRNDFTVMSGLSNPEVAEGHDSGYSFLTGAHHSGFVFRGGFRNTISLDQLAAEHIGGETRYPSLSLSTDGINLSWTRSGVVVPSDQWPAAVFARLFLEGTPDQVSSQVRRLRQGQSILDNVRDQARKMESGLGSNDREKLDEYFTSVRELEQRLVRAEEWSKKPKPKVDAQQPQNSRSEDIIAGTRTWFDLTHLALQTDSTRLITIGLDGSSGTPLIPGVSMNHHDLSHHGQDPTKLAQLEIIERETMKLLGEFLGKLKQTKEEGVSLLDQTMVFFGSNLGSGSSHATTNLPVLLAGGGFKHGQHLAFDPKNNAPLCNVYVSMLQRLGLDVDRFGSSTGTLTGLEVG